jgi:hypothetical protein
LEGGRKKNKKIFNGKWRAVMYKAINEYHEDMMHLCV